MKMRLLTILMILGLVAGLFGLPSKVEAASYGTAFVTSIVYMNTGTGSADVSFLFYAAQSGTPVTYPATGTLTVALHAAGSLYAGTVFTSSFQGSVAVSSTQPLSVVAVQTPPAGSVKVRMLSNGFSAGAATMTIPSVRRTSAQNSVFSVQNADSVAGDLTVKFFVPGNAVPVATDNITNLPAGSAKFYDMGTTITTSSGAIPNPFDGSVVVSAVQTGTSVAGSVVASSQEFDVASNSFKAYAFNAVPAGATKVYMPSAFCNYNQGSAGNGPVDTYYALTNTSDAAINLSVAYSNGLIHSITSLAPGNKAVSTGCGAATVVSSVTPYSGSATITASWAGTPGTGSPSVVAVGKVAGFGYSSAFDGIPDPGPNMVAMPYVRYASDTHWPDGSHQRVFLSLQNVGATQWDGTNKVTVAFYNDAGTLMGTLDNGNTVVLPGQKINFDAHTLNLNFGYWASTVGGGAIVTAPAGGAVAAIARAVTFDNSNSFQWSEDYTGVPVQ